MTQQVPAQRSHSMKAHFLVFFVEEDLEDDQLPSSPQIGSKKTALGEGMSTDSRISIKSFIFDD